MQRGGTDLRASLQHRANPINSCFSQLVTSKPRAFKTYSENYLQSGFSRNYPFFVFLHKESVTNSSSNQNNVLSNKSFSCYPSSSEHWFILICVTTEIPLVSFHFPNDINSCLIWNTNTPLIRISRSPCNSSKCPSAFSSLF